MGGASTQAWAPELDRARAELSSKDKSVAEYRRAGAACQQAQYKKPMPESTVVGIITGFRGYSIEEAAQ